MSFQDFQQEFIKANNLIIKYSLYVINIGFFLERKQDIFIEIITNCIYEEEENNNYMPLIYQFNDERKYFFISSLNEHNTFFSTHSNSKFINIKIETELSQVDLVYLYENLMRCKLLL